MSNAPMKALLVCDGGDDSGFVEQTIADDGAVLCHLVDVEHLEWTLEHLGGQPLDIILLDCAWSTPRLVQTVTQVRDSVPGVPVLLLPEIRNGSHVAQVLRECGAQPQSPNLASATSVATVMRYALRRQRLQRQLLRLALRDDLTGLHNRRGFRLLAGQRLRLASRTRRSLLLFFADLDGLKQINDQFGHAEGDQALTRAAASFRRTFRKTDITARLGGDEFIALVVEEPGRNAQTICERLRMNLAKCGVRESRYDLSLSVGVARFSPEAAPSLQQLMTQADNALYLKKRTRVSHGDELKSALLSGRFPTGRFFNDAGTEAG